jgi:hypothetical protein
MKSDKKLQQGGQEVAYLRTLEEELDQETRKDIVREYAKYAVLPSLSEIQVERMNQILELAQKDSILDFWIGEVDHFLDHELGLWDPEYDRDQQSKLGEFLSVQFYDPSFDKKIEASSEELQSRISGVCSSTVCEIDSDISVSILIKFQKEFISLGNPMKIVHSRSNESAILMDIALSENISTLTLGSTDAENEKTLTMWFDQLPQPYGDIVEAKKFIRDKGFSSDEEVKFFSSSSGHAVALKEAISSLLCPLDHTPLVDHRFRVVNSPQLSKLTSTMN